jgi:CRP-like cAMP-binding protein
VDPKKQRFDPAAFLNASGVAGKVVDYPASALIFSQGDASDSVLYIQRGTVKLSVVSQNGKEAVVGVLNDGEFFGEGALAGQPVRLATATAINATRIR